MFKVETKILIGGKCEKENIVNFTGAVVSYQCGCYRLCSTNTLTKPISITITKPIPVTKPVSITKPQSIACRGGLRDETAVLVRARGVSLERF